MMRRLQDGDRTDPVLDRAVRLLESAPPVAVSTARRARVWRGVVAAEPQGLVARAPWLECASVLLLAAVTATAVVGWSRMRLWGQPAVVASGVATPAITPRATPARALDRGQPALAPPRAPTEDDRRAAEPAPLRWQHPTVLPPDTPPAPGSQPAAEPPAAATQPAAPGVAAPDAGLVLRAVRALRQERDSYRASTLVYKYICLHPDGPLAEEALGLAIEAAAARRDERVVPLADHYLARFPAGRYAAAASQARTRYADLARARGAAAWRIPCGGSR